MTIREYRLDELSDRQKVDWSSSAFLYRGRLPNYSLPVIVKIYRHKRTPEYFARLRELHDVLTRRGSLSTVRTQLSHDFVKSRIAFPIGLMMAENEPVGYAMRDFSLDGNITINLTNGNSELVPSTLDHFVDQEDSQISKGIRPLTTDERLQIFRDLTTTISLLHEGNIIVNDLSFRNVIFARKPKARNNHVRACLLDADSFQIIRSSGEIEQPEDTHGFRVGNNTNGYERDFRKLCRLGLRLLERQSSGSRDREKMRNVVPESVANILDSGVDLLNKPPSIWQLLDALN